MTQRKRRHRKLAAVGKDEDTNVETKSSRKSDLLSCAFSCGLFSCGVVDSALQLVGHIVPTITSQATSVVGSGPSKAQQALIDLPTSANEVKITDSLVVCALW